MTALTKLDYIDLLHGEFDQTDLNDLQQAFSAFAASKKKHLAVFFHGGRVSRSAAKADAEELIDGYSKAKAYPFFFIWNSDLLTAMQAKLFPFAENLVIRRVVERHIQFFTGQVSEELNLPDPQDNLLRAIANLEREDEPPPLTTLAALGRVFDSIWARKPDGATLPPPEERLEAIQTFERELADDPSVKHGKLDERTPFNAERGSGILTRLWKRFRSGHDHGLYTTLIEEIGRTLKIDEFFQKLWGGMKDDIDNAFRGNYTTYGGTAFLNCLSSVWTKDTRLTLIAHSGGTVYIDRMLNVIDQSIQQALLPDIKADIVFIAAALSFEAFANTIKAGVFKRVVNNYRFFALKDECEDGYWEVPGVYDKSLLYLHSALSEGDADADKALVGMQRYWSGKDPYNAGSIPTVTGAIVPEKERVWSPTGKNAQRGYCANARKHGRFALEPKTDDSVRIFLK